MPASLVNALVYSLLYSLTPPAVLGISGAFDRTRFGPLGRALPVTSVVNDPPSDSSPRGESTDVEETCVVDAMSVEPVPCRR